MRLQPGETRELTFRITPDDLKFFNGKFEYDWEPVEFMVRIGGNSTNLKSAAMNWSNQAVPSQTQ